MIRYKLSNFKTSPQSSSILQILFLLNKSLRMYIIFLKTGTKRIRNINIKNPTKRYRQISIKPIKTQFLDTTSRLNINEWENNFAETEFAYNIFE